MKYKDTNSSPLSLALAASREVATRLKKILATKIQKYKDL